MYRTILVGGWALVGEALFAASSATWAGTLIALGAALLGYICIAEAHALLSTSAC